MPVVLVAMAAMEVEAGGGMSLKASEGELVGRADGVRDGGAV